mmetsp:Transcript_51672/g.83383  ORF Transcript_51672/g.83383 Transcript_51672/m.83383 type:complete len:256 (+) Transcript_51672:730-1497(+)
MLLQHRIQLPFLLALQPALLILEIFCRTLFCKHHIHASLLDVFTQRVNLMFQPLDFPTHFCYLNASLLNLPLKPCHLLLVRCGEVLGCRLMFDVERVFTSPALLQHSLHLATELGSSALLLGIQCLVRRLVRCLLRFAVLRILTRQLRAVLLCQLLSLRRCLCSLLFHFTRSSFLRPLHRRRFVTFRHHPELLQRCRMRLAQLLHLLLEPALRALQSRDVGIVLRLQLIQRRLFVCRKLLLQLLQRRFRILAPPH